MKALWSFALILVTTISHAQDCGGMANAGGTCVPPDVAMPGHQQQQPQNLQSARGIWVDSWGAIATYEPNGSLGVSADMQTADAAEKAALDDCHSKHGSICKIQLSYRNQCAAMVVSAQGYDVIPAVTIDLAIEKGMTICIKAGYQNCHVFYTDCSLPIIIR